MIAAMSLGWSSAHLPRAPRAPGFATLKALVALAAGFVLFAAAASVDAGAAATAALPAPPAPAAADPVAAGRPRLVSLNPSLTAIVERLGAAEMLVGVDDYSAQITPSLADRPRVGGLFDPSLEAVMALRPDRVLLVAGLEQESHGKALRQLGLEVEVFENERYEQVLFNIERIGHLVGRDAPATARIAEIRALRAAVERATHGRPQPRTVIVLDRSPLYLVGAETFLDELLRAVGAINLGAEVARGYPRGSLEWLVAAGPDLVLDLSPQTEVGAEAERDAAVERDGRTRASEAALAFWARWPSLPAVKTRRVLALDATRVSLPGPDLDRALRELAVAVHGAEIEAAIERELARRSAP